MDNDKAPRNAIDETALNSLKNKIDELPILPQVLVRILQVNVADEDYFEQVEALATEDPPFAVRLVALANSAGAASVSPIKSIRDALTRVGAVTITNLVASLAVQRVFVPKKPSEIALWGHSISVAVCAETIAHATPTLKFEPGEAYLAGLLHDIGRFVMFEHAPDQLLKVDEANWHTPDELIEADVEIFKFTHSELGYLACNRWSLPAEIADVVRRHHEPLVSPVAAGSVEAGVLCIGFADRLSMLLEKEELDPEDNDGWAELIQQKCPQAPDGKLLMPPAELAAHIPAIKERTSGLMAGLGM
ncbi:MAG: HDOD domain-containing protein [Pseudomonadota bacterium]